MSTQQVVLGNWNQLKGKVKETWGDITDDELQRVGGQFDQLVGLIQRKTGEGRQEIERMVTKLNEQAGGAIGRAASTAREYVDQAGERIRDASHHLRDRTMEGYEEAGNMVRRHPTEAVATAFGTGLLVGLLIGVLAASGMRSDSWR
jgi:uncharacterized protein YjbJ (UPF0337 family)